MFAFAKCPRLHYYRCLSEFNLARNIGERKRSDSKLRLVVRVLDKA